MIRLEDRGVKEDDLAHKGTGDEANNRPDHDFELQQSLEIFDFSAPLPTKREGVLRVFYNNCNGMEINNTIGVFLQQKKDKQKYNYLRDVEAPTKVDSIIRQMKVWEVDVVKLSEMCIAWDQKIPRRVVQQITKNYDRTGCWTVATSKIDLGSFLKPGGAGILALGQAPGKIIDRGVDPHMMGRWAYTLIAGKSQGHTLLLITGYRTGQRTGDPGMKTAWKQQQVMLSKEGRKETPYEAFFMDLGLWLRQYRNPRMEILLSLDANERLEERSEVAKFERKFDLHNINHKFNIPATHPHIANMARNTTIDFCLCSNKVLQNVVYAAAVPYELETLGDHRGIMIDINLASLLGSDTCEVDIKTRKLVMSSPLAVEKYLATVEDKFSHQNIFKRSLKLLKRVKAGHTDYAEMMRQYNKLDAEVFGICTKAEKRCKAAWAGKYEWSPKLVEAITQLRYWRNRLRQNGETAIIKKLGQQLNIPYTELSHFVIQQMINTSQQRLRDVQKEARVHRQNHLETIAQKYADQNNLSKNQAILELLSHEETRNTFQTIKQSVKPYNYSQLKALWVSMDENGNYTKDPATKIVSTEKELIHNQLLDRNTDHLGQAEGTPFAKGWLRQNLRWDGTGKLADDILTGQILNKKKFESAMQLYLECLRMNDMTRLNVVTPELSLDEYRMFWKKKRETTVTSPYGLHVGHYKAALHKLNILNVHRILLLIPFKLGLVPGRWQTTVQTMIEKEPGTPWIHRLRIIELFDAQANAGFQIFVGRKMMQYAVQNGLLQAESFGSTPGKMATSALVQKLVTVDQLRIERRAGGIFDCDASGCYDRILPPVASIHLQALGLHRSIGTFLARLMYQAKRYVRTGHGVSENYIRTTKTNVLYGIGQGNGGGPAMWISHLTVMFAALSSVCIGFALKCVEHIKYATSVGTGYVDDVTLGLSLPREVPQNEHTVHKYLRHMSQLWEKLLFITGGRLELSKCFWVPISWRWSKGIPKPVYTKRKLHTMRLRESETGDRITIPRKKINDAEKRLGVWSSCDGKWTKEVHLWTQFSRDFCAKIKWSGLSRTAGYLAYHSVWIAKFRYSASVIGYSKNQLRTIQSGIIGACLSVAGYSSKLPRPVVFGPKQYGGMDWENVIVLSLFEKLKLLVGSIRLQDKLGKMLVIQLTWLQLFAGISVPLLEYSRDIPYLPLGWLQNIHSMLVDTGIKIEISFGWRPTPQRQEDRVIMDIVHSQIPTWAWAGINRCRLFLQATTVADIVTQDGTFIPDRIRTVRGNMRQSNLLFPIQLRPSNEDIDQWQYLIDSISDQGTLFAPLGKWIRSPDQKFTYMINESKKLIYKRKNKGWIVFGRKQNNSRRYIKLRVQVDTAPRGCTPVAVIEATQYIILVKDYNENDPIRLEPTGMYIERQQCLVQNIMGRSVPNEQMMQELQSKWHTPECEIVCATDGGLKGNIGTSSYAMFFPRISQPIVYGNAGEYQPTETSSSTRQELLGQPLQRKNP